MQKESNKKKPNEDNSYFIPLIAGLAFLGRSIYLYTNDLIGVSINARYQQPVIISAEMSLFFAVVFLVATYYAFKHRKEPYKLTETPKRAKLTRGERRIKDREKRTRRRRRKVR